MTTTDPTMETLLPTRSGPRRALVFVAIVALLLVTWLSTPAFRPTMHQANGGGSWGVENGRVVATQRVVAEWPGFTLTGVRSVEGATVVGAWLVPGTAMERDTPPEDQYRLPQRLGPATAKTLVIHWQIDDCQAANRPDLWFSEEPTASSESPFDATTVFRTPATARYDDGLGRSWLGPAFDSESLAFAGICPAD